MLLKRGEMKLAIAFLVVIALAACGASPKQGGSPTSSLPPKIVPGIPCYHDGPNGKRIMQMDPSIAAALGGYVEVPCP
jgi:hypothetical protein